MTLTNKPGSSGPSGPEGSGRGEIGPLHLLFVCTGNTCRSPMAQSAGRALWGSLARGVELRSAGLSATEGAEASPLARSVAERHGGGLQDHRSHRITAEDLDWADLVLTMTRAQRDSLRRSRPESDQILTLAEFAGQGDADVADPFGGQAHDYEAAYREIERYIRAGTAALEKWARE